MDKIICFVLLFLFSNLGAQISIVAATGVSGKKYKIDIKENKEKYFINLNIFDSIQSNASYEIEMENYREKYFALSNPSITNDSVKSILKQMQILKEIHSVYSNFTAEIEKKDYKKFDHLIKIFKTENIDFFKKNEDPNRIILDGTLFKINVNSKEGDKTIWSQSPNEKSNPEIKDLINSTFEILTENNISFQTRRNKISL